MSITTLTLFGYTRPADQRWAFLQMGLARPALLFRRGLRFWKLLGCGQGNSFTLNADWGRYALLAVWESLTDAEAFFASRHYARYERHADEIWTAKLIALTTHGAWSGQRPFTPIKFAPRADSPIAILTRATLRLRHLRRFWDHVPGANADLNIAPGLLASIGLSELPILQAATFSLWSDEAAMRAFAYGTPQHREIVRKTYHEDWYAESLFARFYPLETSGTWHGRDPLREAQAVSTSATTF